jgi:hypothetical protein
MTQNEIIKMAKQAGFSSAVGKHIALDDDLERFAKLVAQHEREACAKDLDEASGAAKNVDPQGFVWKAVKECADAIRARGQA